MKLDDAAAAFRRTYDACSVQPDNGDGRKAETYHVRLHDRVALPGGLSYDDATALLEQEAGRAAVVSVLREIISPLCIGAAAAVAGLEIRKVQNNRLNMGRSPKLAFLEGLLTILEKDAVIG